MADFNFEVFEFVTRGRGRPYSGLPRKSAYIPVLIDKRGIRIKSEPSERELRMKEMYESGKVLEEIGIEFGITKERVRQLLKKYFGMTGNDGGCFVKTTPNAIFNAIEKKRLTKEKRDQAYQKTFGCDEEQFILINGNNKRSEKGSIAFRYAQQKRNAIGFRNIKWNITFPDWWKIWHDSGKWEQRGRGQGYCMTRKGDTGAYEVGNVEIKTIGQNFSESYYKHPQSARYAKAILNGHDLSRFQKKTYCIKGHEFTEDNIYYYKGKRACKACIKISNKLRS